MELISGGKQFNLIISCVKIGRKVKIGSFFLILNNYITPGLQSVEKFFVFHLNSLHKLLYPVFCERRAVPTT